MKTISNQSINSITKAFLIASCIVLTTSTALCAVSTFGTGVEGWSVVTFTDIPGNNYTPFGAFSATYVATGGNPGGYISSNDPDGGDFVFSAPAGYLGDQSSALGGIVSYDIMHTGSIFYHGADVIVEGSGLRLVWQSIPDLMATNVWQNVSLTLSPSAEWHVGATNGAPATTTDFTNALANVTGFYIRGEYTIGAETTGIDNARLGSVPEPTSAALLGFGIVLLSIQRTKIREGRNG